ncbi:MAG: hypothetical protein ACQEQV_09550 [Fibrobacterota bacterium]
MYKSISPARQIIFPVILFLLIQQNISAAPTDMNAFFRHGQTFLTWQEDGSAEYRIYRHTAPITDETIDEAKIVATVDSNSSRSLFGVGEGIGQTHWIIHPLAEKETGLGQQLRDDQGLFVHTVHEQAQQSYYAVRGDSPDLSDANTIGPVQEKKMRLRPIPICRFDGADDTSATSSGGMDENTYHTTYAWFMDYARWNHAWEGYIFNTLIATPKDMSSRETWPVLHRLDGKSSRLGRYISYAGSRRIAILNESVAHSHPSTSVQDWHYGHVNATGDSVINYTEYRSILSILFVLDHLQGDPERIWGYGHSMGGSGSLSLGMRYPALFSMIYASQPATDYGNPDFTWHGNVSASYGSLQENLPIGNIPFNHPNYPELDALQAYNGTPVYEWQNPRRQLSLRMGDDMALLCLTHGTRDGSIDWQTQGAPFVKALLNSRRPFKYIVNESSHNWQSFNAINYSQLWHNGQQYGSWFDFPRSRSMPGFSGIDIADDTVGSYLVDAEWEVLQDGPDVWEMALSNVNEVCHITPRRCRKFYANPGDSFQVFMNGTPAGHVQADSMGLVTVREVDLTEDATIRLENTYREDTSIDPSVVAPGNSFRSLQVQKAHGIRVIHRGAARDRVTFALYDLCGRRVGRTQSRRADHDGSTTVSWKGQTPGIYLVHATDDYGTLTQKIVWR